MTRRTKSSGLDGLINLHKPLGFSSAQVLYRVRRVTGQRKSGHSGALDPVASGVLVLCLGRGTKLVESIMNQPKVYRATARLDVTSETLDADRPLEPVEVAEVPSLQRLREAMASFEGDIEQVPPRVSAVKIGGKPAYERVRADQTVELAARSVTVYWLHVHRYEFPELDFEMCCGRGTYVRSLIRDLGASLGCGGCLTSLVRSQVGPFTLEDAWSLEAVETADGKPYVTDLDRCRALLDPDVLQVPPRPRDEKPG